MQTAVAERPTTPARTDLTAVAKQCLESHPHFRGRLKAVSISQKGRDLFITGQLPTFYLKQMVQETLRHVPGVQYIDNQIDVVSAEGVSSVRC
jgi:hypothetical protein